MYSEISLHARAHSVPHRLITVGTHHKLEATGTVYIITYTNCFVKKTYFVCSTTVDSSGVLSDKGRSGTPSVATSRVKDPAINT